MQISYLSSTLVLVSSLLASNAMAAPAAANTKNTATTSATTNSQNQPQAQDNNNQAVDMNKVSYSIGYTMGTNLVEQFEQLNQAELLKGFQQGLAKAEPTISKDEMQQSLIAFQRNAMQQRMDDLKKLAETNKQEGEKFLAENKTKPGITTTKSGLQYKVIVKGTGPIPAESDKVSVNYSGKLLNGEIFSSSTELGDKPASFTLSGVIPAWREALKLMPKGSKWEIYVPTELAYGARGTHGKIGPNATLIFTIELVDVEKSKSKA
jgi:FKBP-type peptidyl-prolyl cis-trans isomerase FklB